MYPDHDKNQELRKVTDNPAIQSANRLSSFLNRAIGELKPATEGHTPMAVPPANEFQGAAADEPIRKNITGASQLGADLKATIAAAKANVALARTEVANAASHIEDASSQAVEVAKALNAEADDLLASIGQTSNMPPK